MNELLDIADESLNPADESLNPAAGMLPALLLRRLIGGYRITHAIRAAAQLGIADHLGERPRSAGDLAALLHVNPQALHRLLRALVGIGLLADAGDGLFTLTPVGACLRRDAPDGMRAWALCEGAEYYQDAWMNLPHAVETGETAFEHAHGETFYQHLARHPETGHGFSQAMLDYARLIAKAVVAGYDFEGVRRVVDIGGSHGHLLRAILQANPTVSGVLFDRPAVIERAEERFRGAGLAGRAELVAGDFFESLPAGGDLYILSRVLMDYDDERSVRLLQNCRRAMRPGGRVLIVQLLMPEQGGAPREQLFEAAVSDLNMLVLTGGRERTEGEYRTLLARAGLRLKRVVPTRALVSLIEGELIAP
ncbi:MAG TPA: methyltransferase [Pyrinomonadaceae bacterium]|nr:methyltransferase [Pyrinomonadaceae bacterium]